MSNFSKAFDVFLKALKVLPVVVDVVGRIEAARDPASPGGSKITPSEIAQIAAEGLQDIAEQLGKAVGIPAGAR